MEFLSRVDLDWLCLAAEIAAALLLLSFAWRPAGALPLSQEESAVDACSDSVLNAYVHAATGLGRSLALRWNEGDARRLRELQQGLPAPLRDRLTGTWNAAGMDHLIQEWSSDSSLEEYPSCFARLSIANLEALMQEHGAVCVELVLRRIADLLNESLGGRASIARYQPHCFVLHYFGGGRQDCHQAFSEVIAKITDPEFFSIHEHPIAVGCETHYWFCNRGLAIEELLHLLEECSESSTGCQIMLGSAPEIPEASPELHHAPEEVKPFSIDELAPFPCPWDDAPEESSTTNGDSASGGAGAVEAPNASTLATDLFHAVDALQEMTSFADENPTGLPGDPPHPSSRTDSEFDSSVAAVSAPAADVFEEPQPSPAQEHPQGTEAEMAAERSHHPSEPESVDSHDPAVAISSEIPPAPADSPKPRSIYTDDIEESVLKADLATLFAAVRSSAVGDFPYDSQPGGTLNPEPPNSSQAHKKPGPDGASS